MHIHIDQGVNFSKLAQKYQNSKVGENYFWRTLVAFWLTLRRLKVSSERLYSQSDQMRCQNVRT